MDIYQFAMQMETDGEAYYRQLANEASVPGLAKIFTMLADEEVKHYKVIVNLSRKGENPRATNTAILENVKNVFVGMREARKQLYIDTTEAAASYRKACTMEAESEKFYQEKGAQAEAESERQIFSLLAGEEANHLRIMENILEFVSRAEPGSWLENAEWHHLDEY